MWPVRLFTPLKRSEAGNALGNRRNCQTQRHTHLEHCKDFVLLCVTRFRLPYQINFPQHQPLHLPSSARFTHAFRKSRLTGKIIASTLYLVHQPPSTSTHIIGTFSYHMKGYKRTTMESGSLRGNRRGAEEHGNHLWHVGRRLQKPVSTTTPSITAPQSNTTHQRNNNNLRALRRRLRRRASRVRQPRPHRRHRHRRRGDHHQARLRLRRSNHDAVGHDRVDVGLG